MTQSEVHLLEGPAILSVNTGWWIGSGAESVEPVREAAEGLDLHVGGDVRLTGLPLAVDPRDRDAERVRWDDVVEEALGCVEPAAVSSDPLARRVEVS